MPRRDFNLKLAGRKQQDKDYLLLLWSAHEIFNEGVRQFQELLLDMRGRAYRVRPATINGANTNVE
ncbi:MAG: hypothetical protein MK161_17570 [Pirellulales bacterium]|nr:hypothetical protein [Pirellulales bacterium]